MKERFCELHHTLVLAKLAMRDVDDQEMMALSKLDKRHIDLQTEMRRREGVASGDWLKLSENGYARELLVAIGTRGIGSEAECPVCIHGGFKDLLRALLDQKTQ